MENIVRSRVVENRTDDETAEFIRVITHHINGILQRDLNATNHLNAPSDPGPRLFLAMHAPCGRFSCNHPFLHNFSLFVPVSRCYTSLSLRQRNFAALTCFVSCQLPPGGVVIAKHVCIIYIHIVMELGTTIEKRDWGDSTDYIARRLAFVSFVK